MKWAYGVTTVPMRLRTTLPRTINSLARGGFDQPRLFVDGADSGFQEFGLDLTYRSSRLGPFGNWFLGLWELYIKNPDAERFAMFQDDILMCEGVRKYLEGLYEFCNPEFKFYWNLFTFPHNQPDQLVQRVENGARTHPGLNGNHRGFYRSCGHGKGATALVFSNIVVQMLLGSRDAVAKVRDTQHGRRRIDGFVCDLLKPLGVSELVHNPSLVQHTGVESSIRELGEDNQHPTYPDANSFPGEEFDTRSLLGCNSATQ